MIPYCVGKNNWMGRGEEMSGRKRGEKVFEMEGLLGRQEIRARGLLDAWTGKSVMAV